MSTKEIFLPSDAEIKIMDRVCTVELYIGDVRDHTGKMIFCDKANGTAVCMHGDKFNTEVAIKMAVGRAMQNLGKKLVRQASGLVKHTDDMKAQSAKSKANTAAKKAQKLAEAKATKVAALPKKMVKKSSIPRTEKQIAQIVRMQAMRSILCYERKLTDNGFTPIVKDFEFFIQTMPIERQQYAAAYILNKYAQGSVAQEAM